MRHSPIRYSEKLNPDQVAYIVRYLPYHVVKSGFYQAYEEAFKKAVRSNQLISNVRIIKGLNKRNLERTYRDSGIGFHFVPGGATGLKK